MRIVGIALFVLALIALVPGVSKPILVVTGTVDKAEMVELGKQTLAEHPDVPDMLVSMSEQIIGLLDIEGDIEAYSKTRSILGTIQDLHQAGYVLVAFLIGLFSVIVPVVKSILLVIAALAAQTRLGQVSLTISKLIGKWSMADVFVVAIIVAFLAANATSETEELFTLNASFAEGFYFFLAYCLLSIASTYFLQRATRR